MKKARARPKQKEEKKQKAIQETEQEKSFTTEKYRFLKWIGMLLLGIQIFVGTFWDLIKMDGTTLRLWMMTGYIATVIYAYLEVKAFHHTQSRWKHFGKIFLIALISYIPYSMMMEGIVFGIQYQSMAVTALIGFGVLMIAEVNFEKLYEPYIANAKIRKGIAFVYRMTITMAGTIAGQLTGAENVLYAIPMMMIWNEAERVHSQKKIIVQGIGMMVWCFLMILSKNYYALSAVIGFAIFAIAENREMKLQIKEGKWNENLKKAERNFYPMVLWLFMLIRIILFVIARW